MSKANLSYDEGKIVGGLDMNEDGENSLSVKVDINEAIQEAISKMKKGEEGTVEIAAKKIDVQFGVGGLKLVVDLDQDGEPLLEVDLSMMEAFDEIAGKKSE